MWLQLVERGALFTWVWFPGRKFKDKSLKMALVVEPGKCCSSHIDLKSSISFRAKGHECSPWSECGPHGRACSWCCQCFTHTLRPPLSVCSCWLLVTRNFIPKDFSRTEARNAAARSVRELTPPWSSLTTRLAWNVNLRCIIHLQILQLPYI